MKKWIIPLLLLSTSVAVFGERREVSLSVLDYVEQSLAHSDSLQAAVDSAEQALEAYEDAQLSRQSSYSLALLENEYRYRKGQVLSTENAEVLSALQHIFAGVAAEGALDFAGITEEIRAAEYARADALAKKDYISLAEKHAAHMAYLQASSAVRTATDQYRAAQKNLIRSVEQSWDTLEIQEFPLSVPHPDIPEAERIIAENAYVEKLEADLALFVERREFLRDSQIASPAELHGIDEDIEQTEQLLRQQIWILQDSLDQLLSQLEGNHQATTIAELNIEVRAMDLATAQHQYDNGDIYASDLAQVELQYSMAVEQLSSLKRSSFMLALEALSLTNESLKAWITERWAEGSKKVEK